ncbi:MAG TPA: TIM-barrel domain-containing protein [Candidatus Acidoferrales bacterium]|nr:TIM-barrel domain-containing protein [Candidatus Acidoferrales bacterium]
MNRRELGKGVVASVIGAVVRPAASAGAQEGAAASSIVQWQDAGPGIWRATIGRPEEYTPVKSRLVEPKLEALRAMAAVSNVPLGEIRGEITARGTMLRLPLAPHEGVYGFGLQLLSFAQRGKKKTMRVNADPRVDSGDTHAPVPFYVTTAGYGVLVDTARYAAFYSGDAHDAPPKTTSGSATDQPGEMIIEIPRAKGVDVYLFAGPDMLAAVRRYNLFSGGGVLPPEWGLGFWYRADKDFSQADALALAKEFRDSQIPCDVFGLEPGWQTHAYSCTFVWDNKKFPEPAAFVKQLGANNFKLNLWEHSFTHPDSPLFALLTAHSGDMAVWGGLVPDFAGEDGRRIFGGYHGKNLIDLGVAGFKLDECDNSDFTGGWSFPEFSRFPSGIDGEQMHSVFGLRYQRSILDEYKQRGIETYGLVRSSGALAAPYPFVLYSDLYDHRQFIRGVVNSGFSGLLWCPEVRDAASEEDLIRRLQSVVFSPLAMINAWYIVNPPWKQIDRAKNNANQLAENWQTLEARCREIIGWRMQIVPYLRAAFAKYAADGTPPFRALVMDSPGDAALAQVDDEYMIGDRMLVAPLFAGEASRRVTLPAGRWHDFWTGDAVQGRTFSVPGTTEKIPVYVKSGSLLPVASVSSSAADPGARELTVMVFGDGSLPFSMATPNGETLELLWDSSRSAGNARQMGAKRPYKIVSWKRMG